MFMLPLFRTKTSAAGLSVVSNTLLVALKLVVGLLISSMAVIADAIDSATDVLAGALLLFSVRMSTQPADAQHPFGHGKIEGISATVEAGWILLAAGSILYQAVQRILAATPMGSPIAGIAVMAVSALVKAIVSMHLRGVAQLTDSIALRADADNLWADVIRSLGIMAGLAAVQLTSWDIIDPLIAIGVALLMFKMVYDLARASIGQLLDVKLPADEERIILDAISGCLSREAVNFHELRSRKAGSERHIDLHLVFPRMVTVEEAHALCDCVEENIKAKLAHSHVTIHIEPCDGQCEECHITCDGGNNN